MTDSPRLETELLRYTARTRLDPRARQQIEHLLSRPLDWDYFLQTAVMHGVAALCFAQLQTVSPERAPAETMERLREHARAVAARNLYLAAKLTWLVGELGKRGVTAIPYKGPVLAAMAYRNLALREFTDLDLVLSERDLPRAWEWLESEGYKAEEAPARAGGSNGTPGQYAFVSPADDSLIELHTELTLRHFPRPLDPSRLSRSLVPAEVNGKPIPTFPPEETLVFLSVHGAKDFWARLLWIADVAELVQIPPGFDWKSALAAANELGCDRLVRLAILLANGVLDAPIPPGILDYANGDRGAKTLTRMVSEWLFASEPSGVGVRAFYRARMVEGLWPGARYAWRLATAPTMEDRRAVRLPGGLGFLYRLVRPIRLLRWRDRH